ncbi:hypothetical protein BJ912DRAFT_995179 [Pholiota molesta]|nr:hypothetical protein BJ912DRAFT_995179 [Pholiota molesta]
MISFTSVWLCLPALWMCSVDALRLYFSSVLLPFAVTSVSRKLPATLSCSTVSSRSCNVPHTPHHTNGVHGVHIRCCGNNDFLGSEWRRKYAGWRSSSVHSGIVRPAHNIPTCYMRV